LNLFTPKASIRVATLADIHYGKRTATYNTDICERRLLTTWAEELSNFREKNTQLHLFLLGDVNDGSMIYAGQEHHQALLDVREQAKRCAQLLAKLTERLRQDYESITWHCVPGNHGRTSKFAAEAANWDIQTYDTLSLLVQLQATLHCTVDAYDAERIADHIFLRRVRLYTHNYALHHGHTIHSYQTIPWYGILQRALRWHSAEPFKLLCLGHFHGSGLEPFNGFEMMRTGSPMDGDDWALETLGVKGDKHGWTFAVSEREALLYPTRIALG